MAGCCVTISPDPRWRPRLVIMVKLPRPGRVKTRLARGIGSVAAAWWMRREIRRLRRLLDGRWETVLAIAPDGALLAREWPLGFKRIQQGSGNLGARMWRVLRQMPPGPVCIIGGDIPGITRAHIARAFQALGRADMAYGPTLDGGYWLVGHRRRGRIPAGLFEHVRWSSETALADSIASTPDQRIALIDVLQDVDDAADLQAVSARIAPRER